MDYTKKIIAELKTYLESIGITVNINKTKAGGNKGFFKVKDAFYRIDIARDLPDESFLPVIIHEFAHYVHYKYDKSLKSLDFILGKINDEMIEELIKVTVESIPKSEASILFEQLKEAENITNPNIKSKIIQRIKNKIYRINKYYNSPTELFARFIEMYFLNKDKLITIAPICYDIISKKINHIAEFQKLDSILNSSDKNC